MLEQYYKNIFSFASVLKIVSAWFIAMATYRLLCQSNIVLFCLKTHANCRVFFLIPQKNQTIVIKTNQWQPASDKFKWLLYTGICLLTFIIPSLTETRWTDRRMPNVRLVTNQTVFIFQNIFYFSFTCVCAHATQTMFRLRLPPIVTGNGASRAVIPLKTAVAQAHGRSLNPRISRKYMHNT